jgi:hypothetical protein
MGPLATWSLIGAVAVAIVFVRYIYRGLKHEAKMDQRWLERKWLEEHAGKPGPILTEEQFRAEMRQFEPAVTVIDVDIPHPLYDQDEDA